MCLTPIWLELGPGIAKDRSVPMASTVKGDLELPAWQ